MSLLSIPALFIANRTRTEKVREEKLRTVEKTMENGGFGANIDFCDFMGRGHEPCKSGPGVPNSDFRPL